MRVQPPIVLPATTSLEGETRKWADDLTRVLDNIMQKEAEYRRRITSVFRTEAELLAASGQIPMEAYAMDTKAWFKWDGTTWRSIYVGSGSATPVHNGLGGLQGGDTNEYYHLDHEDYDDLKPNSTGIVLKAGVKLIFNGD
jgi:hypothetical protein